MRIIRALQQLRYIVLSLPQKLLSLSWQLDDQKILSAKLLINQMRTAGIQENLHPVEFKVFSQFGEDGIIQYLIHHLKLDKSRFIEFGVENYQEANTRFLLINNYWKGLVIDGDQGNINLIKNDVNFYKYDLTAVCSFITQENINQLFLESGFQGEIGLLSIDIDGNDYWVWEAITAVNPIIVVVEYNSYFGNQYAITVPYNPTFSRQKAHYSYLYWGCSLKALCHLAERKGYSFVGSNQAGNNAFFVRKDRMGPLKPLTLEAGYVESGIRDSRNEQGQLTFVGGRERIKLIQEMPVYDIERDQVIPISALGELIRE